MPRRIRMAGLVVQRDGGASLMRAIDGVSFPLSASAPTIIGRAHLSGDVGPWEALHVSR